MKRLSCMMLVAASCSLPFAEQRKQDSAVTALPLLALLGAVSGSSVSCSSLSASTPSGTAAADRITSAPGDAGSGFFDARCSIDGVRGMGDNQGSTDVFSLAATGSSSVLVLEWNGKKITNGVGADFIVFENSFNQNGNATTRFMEPVIVEVSYDGSHWCGFNPIYSSGTYSQNPANWTRFAGTTNSYFNQDSNSMNATTLFTSGSSGGGGDQFDLGNLVTGATSGYNCSAVVSNSGCAAGDVSQLQGTSSGQGVVYVRMIAATACTNPNAGGATFPQDSGAFGGGPDIDGVIARNVVSRP